MSGPQAEAAFDESVFDTAEPDKVEAAAVETAAEPAKTSDPKSQLMDAAKKNGWAGKEDWKGAEADWLDAPEFIMKAMAEVMPSMRKALEDAKAEVKDLKGAVRESVKHLSKARQEGYEQRSRELQSELARFAEAGDVASVKAVTDDIVALEKEVREDPKVAEPEPDEPPAFKEWREANPWFGVDDVMTFAASKFGEQAIKDGYIGKAQIKEVDRRLREKFPDHFAPKTNPNRTLPGAVEGATQARPRGGKSFSDMPREHQEMCLDLMKQSKSITKENYAREFFAEEKH